MQFRILGPLQVLDGDAEVPLGSPKEWALLAVLLLHAGAVVSRERLIEALWGESPPPTAAKALNVHVSQLRKTLGHDGQAPIRTRAPGYAIDVEAEMLDAMRFERLAADARTRVAAGDVASASRLFRDALSLWRGPALDGIELESQARHEAARLDELRLGAQMDRIDCELALGSHEQLITELEALVNEHPLRERLRAQLILALYRSGRQADALRCYRETRETLVSELGIEPSPALQRLEKAVLNQDRSLEAPDGISGSDASRVEEPSLGASPRRPRLWLVPAAALLLGGVVAGVALTRSSTKPLLVPPNAVGVIDPSSDRVVAAVPVGRRPGPIAYSDGTVWIANLKDATLTRVDAKSRRSVGSTPVGGPYPAALAASGTVAWSADPVTATVKRIAGTSVRQIEIHNPVCGIPCKTVQETTPCYTHISVTIGGGKVWITCGPDFGRATLTAIDPATDRQSTTEYTAANDPTAIVYAHGALWVANNDTNSVVQLDPSDRSVVRSVTVAARPTAITAYGDSIWVVGSGQNAVSHIELTPDTGAPVVTNIPVGRAPTAIAAGAGAVWVANSGDDTISKIDPHKNRVTATIGIGAVPAGVVVGAGAVWVSAQAKV